MYYIEPHIHMAVRTTDDYYDMAQMGCVAVSEPAFWAGFDRGSAESFHDYFRQLVEYEPRRAANYAIEHYCWLCINAKEAEDRTLSREVIALIPEFLDRPNVLGLGEVGLHKNTRNECLTLLDQIELAAKTDELLLVHTPHLADKYQGTHMTMDMLKSDGRIPPERVIIDHAEEHTVRAILDAGYWCGLTLYPTTKVTPQRAVDIIEIYGYKRIWINSAADWGPSRPRAVQDVIVEMRLRGHSEDRIRKIVYDTPLAFFSQSKRFNPPKITRPTA